MQLPLRVDAGEEADHVLVEERVARLDGRVHRHAVALRGEKHAVEHDAGAERQRPVERVPPRHPLPRVGEHTFEVLRDLGYEEREIDALARQGAIAGLRRMG